MAKTGPIWQRLPKEPGAAWEAFLVFRGLSPTDRSITRALAEAHPDHGRSIRDKFYKWAKEWNWSNRAVAFDNHRDQVRVQAEDAAIRRMYGRQIKQAQIVQDWGEAVLEKHVQLAKNDPDYAAKVSVAIDALIKAASLERVARGVPDHITAKVKNPDTFAEFLQKTRKQRGLADRESPFETIEQTGTDGPDSED